MAIGDLTEVDFPSVSDVYALDTGMYGTAGYGVLYIVDAPEPAVIDTGMGTNVGNTVAALDSLGIESPTYIVPTHVHLDHAGGAGFLAEEYPDATVLCHEVGVRHLVDPTRLWAGTEEAVGTQFELYREPIPVPAERIEAIAGGDTIDLGDRVLDVYDAPGHSPHQAIFHSPDDDAVFVADAAGIYAQVPDRVRATSPPPTFDLEGCLADVETIRELDPAVLLYAHFGAAETGEKLDTYERVLTEWVREIEALRERLGDDEAVVREMAARAEPVEPWDDRKVREEAIMNTQGVLRYLDLRDE